MVAARTVNPFPFGTGGSSPPAPTDCVVSTTVSILASQAEDVSSILTALSFRLVVELVDTHVLGTCAERRVGSTPTLPTFIAE